MDQKVDVNILHICESYDENIQSALESYIDSSKDLSLKHFLLAKDNKNNDIGNHKKIFHNSCLIKGGLWAFFRKMKQQLIEIKPDIVHLHSSYAGFLGRFLPEGKYKLIYTPHCYSFERQDISANTKLLFMKLEKIRIEKLDVIAGCSERECALAANLGANKTLLLNAFSKAKPKANIVPDDPPPFNIYIHGRISEQKDPLFLINVIRRLKKHPEYKRLKFHWLGDGNARMVKLLKNHSVSVSGFLPKHKILANLQQAHLCLHLAAWDGTPLNLLEAAKLHIPTIVRFTPALQGISYPFIALTPDNMTQQIIQFIRDPYQSEYLTSLNLLNKQFTQEKQKEALQELYSQITQEK